MTRQRHCAACERPLGPGEVYYRFAVALEGELDAIAGAGAADDELASTIRKLEEGPDDPAQYDDEVHWERAGVLCGSCRVSLMAMFGSRKPEAH